MRLHLLMSHGKHLYLSLSVSLFIELYKYQRVVLCWSDLLVVVVFLPSLPHIFKITLFNLIEYALVARCWCSYDINSICPREEVLFKIHNKYNQNGSLKKKTRLLSWEHSVRRFLFL